ncbi:MAG: SulP family sulfate permease, partial [Arenicella sp.]
MTFSVLNLPLLRQAQHYSYALFKQDLVASMIVAVMLMPQSLAYSMLAGLPPVVGLYASILPLLIYALLGSSRTLSVGPVAIASLMTASALGELGATTGLSYAQGATLLALMSGCIMLLLGLFRFGFVSNFLSHSVVAGFISASGLLIALGQLSSVSGFNPSESISASIHLQTLCIGGGALAFLVWSRHSAQETFMSIGLSQANSQLLTKLAPLLGVLLSTALVYILALDQSGVKIVGVVPVGLPSLVLPEISFLALESLFIPALLISLIGYVESYSVGKTLGSKRQQKVDGNQELVALGAANVASSMVGAFPVTGGFSRSVVNFDAGARTQFASIFTALMMALAAMFLTPYLYYLPKAMLAATIIVAVLSLLDIAGFKKTWRHSKSDFLAMSVTVMVTLIIGVEAGVACGVIVSILLHLYYTSKPHIAEVGLVPGTQHFRNIKNYTVETNPRVISLRVDESLLFSNVSFLQDYIDQRLLQADQVEHIVLVATAINTIDY